MNEQKHKIKMDNLLDQAEPYATFHDAELNEIKINYTESKLSAEFDLCVGNPEATTDAERERRRKGILHVSRLICWAIDPPSNAGSETLGSLWLTDDGLIIESSNKTAKELAATLTPETYGWYLYFNNLNAFAYLVAKKAEFEWKSA